MGYMQVFVRYLQTNVVSSGLWCPTPGHFLEPKQPIILKNTPVCASGESISCIHPVDLVYFGHLVLADIEVAMRERSKAEVPIPSSFPYWSKYN